MQDKNRQIQSFCGSWLQIAGETVISLYRFASTAFFPFFPEERASPPLKESTIRRLYGVNEVFQFLHLCICIAPVTTYLGIYLLYLQGKVHMCSLCKGALADLGLHVQSGERCRCKSTQSKLKVKPQRVQRTEETA